MSVKSMRGVIARVVAAAVIVGCGANTPAPASTPAPAPASATPPATATLTPSASTSSLPPPRPATLPLSSGSQAPADLSLAAGDDAFEHGDLVAAARNYTEAKKSSAFATAAAVGLARVRIARAGVALDYGAAKGNAEVTAASRELARLCTGKKAFAPALVELGRARLLLGDAAGAVDSLRRGVELLPAEPEAHSQLGVALLATGHPADAVKELARAAELDPGSAARHGNLGTALMMAGRTAEAVTEYETRARIDDSDARAHSDLGTALLGTQDLERAVGELQRAVALAPDRASFHSNLGYAEQQMGHVDKAIAQYREAIRLDPKLASAWINLATALARQPSGRAEARSALERAKALSPDDPRVSANLEELDSIERGADKSGGHGAAAVLPDGGH